VYQFDRPPHRHSPTALPKFSSIVLKFACSRIEAVRKRFYRPRQHNCRLAIDLKDCGKNLLSLSREGAELIRQALTKLICQALTKLLYRAQALSYFVFCSQLEIGEAANLERGGFERIWMSGP
jgi:hypothetical protein